MVYIGNKTGKIVGIKNVVSKTGKEKDWRHRHRTVLKNATI